MRVASVDADIQTWCIQDLKEGMEYFFRVYAESASDFSEPFETSEAVLISVVQGMF